MLSGQEIFGLISVSVIWGVSNVYLKKGVGSTNPECLENRSRILKPVLEFWNLLKNWRFSLPFAINQFGSVAFYVLLSQLPLTLVVPVVNSLTFLVTAVCGFAIGEPVYSLTLWFGAALIVLGIAICLSY